jgi:hypothetical protein
MEDSFYEETSSDGESLISVDESRANHHSTLSVNNLDQ